jgi:glutaredoxin 3
MSKTQAKITVYLDHFCPYCVRVKGLLNSKEVEYEEIDVGSKAELREEMIQKSNGATSVPQIVIGDHHVGGCDDVFALESSGKLNELLFPQG